MKHLVDTCLLFLFLTVFCVRSAAQFEAPPVVGSGQALGGCFVSLRDESASVHNLGGLGFIEHSMVAIGIQQSFLQQGLCQKNIQASFSTKSSGTWALDYHHHGNTDYYEQVIALEYGLAIDTRLSIGASINYLSSGTSDAYYSPQRLLSFAIGMQYRPTDNLVVGALFFNPTAIRMITIDETRVPMRYNAGISYDFCKELTGILEIEKNMSFRPSVRFGVEYNYLQHLFARIGYCTNPNSYAFGVGYRSQNFGIDIGSQMHQMLGLSPQVSVHYLF